MENTSNNISFISESSKDTLDIAMAFVRAVTETPCFQELKAITIGLIGEPDSGKSSFSEAIVKTHPPKENRYDKDQYGQFSYHTDDGISIRRSDLIAMQTMNDVSLTTSYLEKSCIQRIEEPHYKHIELIEHADQTPSLRCDIELTISFMKDGQLVNICDMEEALWEQELKGDGIPVDFVEDYQEMYNSTIRHININFKNIAADHNTLKDGSIRHLVCN